MKIKIVFLIDVIIATKKDIVKIVIIGDTFLKDE